MRAPLTHRRRHHAKAAGPLHPGPRGWAGPGRGRSVYVQAPAEWRATSVQACGLWPFSVGAGAPLIGAPLGKHVLTGATVCGDPISWFQRAGLLTAPTAFVMGLNGFGKSTVIRRMMLSLAGFGVLPLVLGDLKPDYVDLVDALDGQVIRLGRGRGYLNVLDMTLAQRAAERLGDGEHAKLKRELLADAAGRRHTMVSALISIQRGHPPNDREDSILAAALRVLDERHAGVPVLADLLEVIESAPDRVRLAAFDRGSLKRYQHLVEPLQVTLQALLGDGRIGEMFSRHSTVTLDLDRPAAFDVSSIPEDQTELVGAALAACWGVGFGAVNVTHTLAEAGLAPMRHYLIVLDELWRALIAGRGNGRPHQQPHPPKPPMGGWRGDVLAHHQRPALAARRARADEGAGTDRTLGHADLRRAATRGNAATGANQGLQRCRATPADLLAGPAGLEHRRQQRRATRPRELHDQARRAARDPVPRDPDPHRSQAERHQQTLASRQPPRRPPRGGADGAVNDRAHRHATGTGQFSPLIAGILAAVIAAAGAAEAAVQVGAKLDHWRHPPPLDPVSLALELADGKTGWPPAATALAATAGSVIALLALTAAALLLRARARGTHADRAAPVMGRGRDIHPVSRANARATAKRFGITHEGLPVGRAVSNGQALYATWEDMQCDIWGPRRGKTSARAIPTLLSAPGAAFATSNKPDLHSATRLLREQSGRGVELRSRTARRRAPHLVVEPADLRDLRSPGDGAHRRVRRRLPPPRRPSGPVL